MNWKKNWPTVAFFGSGLLLVAGLFVYDRITGPKGIGFFYESFSPAHGYVYHLDKNCQDRMVYVKAPVVFDRVHVNFCSSCIGEKQMAQIEDSLSLYKDRRERKAEGRRKIESLYHAMRREGAASDLDSFAASLWKPDAVKHAYDLLASRGYDYIGSEAEFSADVLISLIEGEYEL
ncbi:MAG: hypothetical protein IJU13_06560 [Bacteroidales bacterium]|nr:hypothetical protein [Bacteroidales bacterium]